MKNFFLQYPLLVPLFVWGIAQGMKMMIRFFDPAFNKKYIASSGGMPSVHSATVCSLLPLAAVVEGFFSVLFAVVCIIVSIVLYDATHVRYQVAKHASWLNVLLKNNEDFKHSEKELTIYVGHTVLEVAAGSILGIGLGCLFVLV